MKRQPKIYQSAPLHQTGSSFLFWKFFPVHSRHVSRSRSGSCDVAFSNLNEKELPEEFYWQLSEQARTSRTGRNFPFSVVAQTIYNIILFVLNYFKYFTLKLKINKLKKKKLFTEFLWSIEKYPNLLQHFQFVICVGLDV